MGTGIRVGIKVAAALVIVGVIGLAIGVGLFDYRAGIICFSLLTGAVGIWHLSQE